MKKRILSAITAIAMATTAMFGMTSSATNSVVVNDPNGSNGITLSDANYIQQYLNAQITPTNLDIVDFDKNGVITYVDAAKVMNCIVNGVAHSVQNSVSETTNISNNVSYNIFNAQTGNYILAYTLNKPTVSPNDTGNAVESRSIIGIDDRVVDWTKTGTVKIIYGNSEDECSTGFVVGPHVIATAAHCVYQNSTGKAYENIKVKLFNSNGTTAMTCNAVEAHVPMKHIETSGSGDNGTSKWDYALISVNEDLSAYMQYDLAVARDYAITNNLSVSNTGFPQIVNNTTVNTRNTDCMYSSSGHLVDVQTDRWGCDSKREIFISNDTTGGNSGSPVYITESYNGQIYYNVIGLVYMSNLYIEGVEGNNRAIRMTTSLLRFFKDNPFISY